jgi:hypothetical protein
MTITVNDSYDHTCELFETQRTKSIAGFYGYSCACFIMTAFYIGNGLNDVNLIQINNDCFVSHTIWFTIDCIYETVMLRFYSILCQLEKKNRVFLPCPDCILLIWFNLRNN